MRAKLPALAPQQRIPLIYAGVAALWIFFSDALLYALFSTAIEQLPMFSVLKGFAFILFTALLLHALLDQTFKQRDRAEAELRESELRFRQLTENIKDVFFLRDLETDAILYVSPSYETLWGRTRQSLYQEPRSFLDGIHPDDRERVVETFDQRRRGEAVQVIYRVVRPNHKVRWVRSRTFPVREADGTFRRMAGIVKDITDQVRHENQLKRLAQQLVNVLDQERRRIARELHDQVGQQLTGLGITLGILQASLGETHALASRLADAAELVSTTIERIRYIISDLRPPVLDDLGLVAGIAWYCEKFAQRTGLKVTFTHALGDYNPAPDLSDTLYHVVQEGLTNAVKHAQAQQLTVDLRLEDDLLVLRVCDDGKGFDTHALLNGQSNGHWGLHILRERVRTLVGARLHVKSAPHAGTEIKVEVPL